MSDDDLMRAELEVVHGDNARRQIGFAKDGARALGLHGAAAVDAYQDRNDLTGAETVEGLAKAGAAMKRQSFASRADALAELARLKSDSESLAAFGNASHPKHREVTQRHRDALDVAYPVSGV